MKDKTFFLIIDGSSLLTTQFYGNLPKEIMFAKTIEEKEKFYHKIMKNSKGVYTNAIYGFFRTLFKILRDQAPSHLAVAWDISRNTFRRELYSEYKAQRSETVQPLKDQFILCQKALEQMGICQLMNEKYEADDFSGTLAALFENEIPVRIMTKDNDYLQLITENTRLWLIHGNAKKTEELFKKYNMDPAQMHIPDRTFEFTPQLVKEEFGIEPASVPSLKGLQGDSSDNIKGVPGVGEKAAAALIGYYGTVDKLYDDIIGADEEKRSEINAKWKKELGLSRSPMVYLLKEDNDALVGEKAARLSTQLATIKRDVELPSNDLNDYLLKFSVDGAKKILNELEFKSLVNDLPEQKEILNIKTEYQMITDLNEAEQFFRSVLSDKSINYLAVSRIKERSALFGYAFAFRPEQAVFIRTEGFLTEELIGSRLKQMIQKNIRITAFGIKEISMLAEYSSPEFCFDNEIAAYLLNPLKASYPYDSVSMDYISIAPVVRTDLPKEFSLFEAEQFGEKNLVEYCCAECITALRVQPVLEKELARTEMLKLFREIEMPLVFTLYRMEKSGIKADPEELVLFGKRLEEGIRRLEQSIYKDAGEQFNINSPKQLGVILFDKLGLPHGKKTKTGYSTSVDLLEKLRDDYTIVDEILEFRQLSKLKSTYTDSLTANVGKDQRIRSKFNQTVTATGRLSCSEPNLQNIPIRTELGRSVRKVFIPEEGYVFVDADYSQIELRILAAMSEDENLINAYRQKMDIHRLTASQVFHVPFNEVTAELRSNAKAVNFGIVYGISSFGLSQGLDISRKEAEQYINRYFETYPVIKKYLESCVEEGKQNGFVRTLFGRIRPIPELSSDNYNQRSFGERVAMNSPIQGTAADIIKIAMIHVEKRLCAETKKSRLILQIHDELLVEAAEEEKEQVKAILQDEMQNAAKLCVPLEVDVKEGSNWYEAK